MIGLPLGLCFTPAQTWSDPVAPFTLTHAQGGEVWNGCEVGVIVLHTPIAVCVVTTALPLTLPGPTAEVTVKLTGTETEEVTPVVVEAIFTVPV
jgi:hypothetical protein